jgi:hypothetical protein
MCFDFMVMCLLAYQLAWAPTWNGVNVALHDVILWRIDRVFLLIFLLFQTRTFLFRVATIMVLDLDAITSVIFNVLAVIASTVS